MKFGKDAYIMAALCGVGIILIFGLSWQSNPNLKGLPFIPSWLYNWTDSYKNGTIRTAVPFIALSLILGAWLSFKKAPTLHFFVIWAVLVGIVILAEFGQYFIPRRDVDIKDILWGSAGSCIGLGLTYLANRLTSYFRRQRHL